MQARAIIAIATAYLAFTISITHTVFGNVIVYPLLRCRQIALRLMCLCARGAYTQSANIGHHYLMPWTIFVLSTYVAFVLALQAHLGSPPRCNDAGTLHTRSRTLNIVRRRQTVAL